MQIFHLYILLIYIYIFILFEYFQTAKGRSETLNTSLMMLQSYLTYIRLSKTVERNLLFIESLKQNMSSVEGTGDGKKMTKPQDLIRPYEIIIQVCHFK